MEIEKAYLIITVAVKSSNSDIHFPILRQFSEDNSCSILLTGLDGKIRGSKSRPILKPKITIGFWKESIETIVLYENFNKDGFNYLTLFYLLKPDAIKNIFTFKSQNPSKNTSSLFSRLIIDTFPDIDYLNNLSENGIVNDSSFQNYKLLFQNSISDHIEFYKSNACLLNSFFIAIPSDFEIKKLKSEAEKNIDFLQRFECHINRNIKGSVNTPYYYYDFIESVFDSLIFSQTAHLRIIIATNYNQEKNQRSIVIPYSILHLHEFDIKIHMLEVIRKKLSNLYAFNNEIEKYIDSISQKDVFKNYSKKYKKDRLDFINAKFEILSSINTIKNEVLELVPYFMGEYAETMAIKGISNSESPFSYTIIRYNNKLYESHILYIESTLHDISNKDTYINEYIRDVISIESIWGNLKVQNILKKLNYVVIVIGAFSIYLSIYHTETRELINSVCESINKFF